MYYLKTFGNLKIPLYNAEVEWGNVVTGNTTVPLPGGGEFDLYGTTPAPVAPKVLVFTGILKARTAAELRLRLEQWEGKQGYSDVLTRKGQGITSDDYAQARLEEVRYPSAGIATRTYVPITLVFQMQSAWLRGGLTLIMTGPANGNAVITNPGNRVAKPIISVVVLNTATDITVSHYGTGANGINGIIAELKFDMPATPAGNDTVIFDTQALRVSLNGANAYAYFTFGTNHKRSEWMPLLPGANPLRVFTHPINALVSWSVTYDIPMY